MCSSDLEIPDTFFDYWHKISFPAGTEKMNGERALAYVRARYIEGSEGGDFRRAARQQQVLLALRDKVFSVQTALDFGRINTILNSLSDNIRTDLQLWEMKRLFEMARFYDPSSVSSVVLSTGPKGVLVGETEILGGSPASVLRPRTGDYSEIQAMATGIFDQANEDTPTPPTEELVPPEEITEDPEVTPEPSPEPVVLPDVEIRNGTNVTGLAKRTSDELTAKDYTVTSIGNAATRNNSETKVYALRDEHVESAKTIAEILSAQADSGLPEGESASDADVLVILGADAE